MFQNKIDLVFIRTFNFFKPQTNFNASFVPLLLVFIKKNWPSDALLQMCLGGLDKNIIKAIISFFNIGGISIDKLWRKHVQNKSCENCLLNLKFNISQYI
jgi:hypothetical protein